MSLVTVTSRSISFGSALLVGNEPMRAMRMMPGSRWAACTKASTSAIRRARSRVGGGMVISLLLSMLTSESAKSQHRIGRFNSHRWYYLILTFIN